MREQGRRIEFFDREVTIRDGIHETNLPLLPQGYDGSRAKPIQAKNRQGDQKMELWSGFFIAQVGASAALAGLIFVSVSLNLAKILALSHLPKRAFQALTVLMEILIVSSLALVPQPLPWFGGEAILISMPIWITVIVFDAQTLAIAGKEYRSRSLQRMAISQAAALLFVIGAVATLAFGLAGVYWLAPAIICSYFIALLDAWVLLVEINR
jgi:modulator of FtsH protease